jgi:hypothetical protein
MNMSTVIAVIALVLVVCFAVRYIVKEKKKGTKCIGCPMAGQCEKYNNELMTAFQAASAEMYAAQQQAQQGGAQQGPQAGPTDNGSNNNGNPTAEDVDFEEVK